MKYSLGISDFFKDKSFSLIFLIIVFSSISFIIQLRLSYLSLISSGILHSDGYIFLFLCCLQLLFFCHLLVRSPKTNILPFCISFSWGWSLSLASVHSSSGTLSTRSNHLNLCHFHCVIIKDLI